MLVFVSIYQGAISEIPFLRLHLMESPYRIGDLTGCWLLRGIQASPKPPKVLQVADARS